MRSSAAKLLEHPWLNTTRIKSSDISSSSNSSNSSASSSSSGLVESNGDNNEYASFHSLSRSKSGSPRKRRVNRSAAPRKVDNAIDPVLENEFNEQVTPRQSVPIENVLADVTSSLNKNGPSVLLEDLKIHGSDPHGSTNPPLLESKIISSRRSSPTLSDSTTDTKDMMLPLPPQLERIDSVRNRPSAGTERRPLSRRKGRRVLFE